MPQGLLRGSVFVLQGEEAEEVVWSRGLGVVAEHKVVRGHQSHWTLASALLPVHHLDARFARDRSSSDIPLVPNGIPSVMRGLSAERITPYRVNGPVGCSRTKRG